MHVALLAAILLTAVATPDAPSADTDREYSRPEARESGDDGARLRLVATLLLEGKHERAREIAGLLLKSGALAAPKTDVGRGRTRRAFELLTGARPDPEAALAALGEKPDSGDIAWPVARALALARGGESHEAAEGLEELARLLRRGAGLELRHVRFTARVDGFGVYEDDTRTVIHPGDSLLLYAELRGFVCEPHEEPTIAKNDSEVEDATASADAPPDDKWRVHLEVRVSIEKYLSGDAGPAWDPEPIEHVTRAKVHDLHITRLVTLPADLPPGEYELRLEVRDLAPDGAEGVGFRRFIVQK
jgi:hypothetical protein